MVGGLGITMIVIALGAGVVVPDADNNFVGLVVLTGLVCLLGAIGGWLAVAQPYRHFDDINVPAEEDHHHTSHADENHADAAPAQH